MRPSNRHSAPVPSGKLSATAPRRRPAFRAAAIASAALLAASWVTLASAGSATRVEAASNARIGGVVAWGAAKDPVVKSVPASAKSGVISIAASPFGDSALALKTNGTVVAWGDKRFGQTKLPAGLKGVTAIAMGDRFGLALTSKGEVVAWGDSSGGATKVPAAARSGVRSIAAGKGFAIAVKRDGSLVAWGAMDSGALSVPKGTGGEALTGVRSVSAASAVLAVRSDGTVIGWGVNDAGQAAVPSDLGAVIGIAAGPTFGLALRADGSVAGWGDDANYQLDSPCVDWRDSVCWGHETGYTALAAGAHHTVALRPDGTVEAWGLDDRGQTDVPDNLEHVFSISAGPAFSLALVRQFAPNAPTGVQAAAGNKGAKVSWQAPTWDGNTAIKYYTVVAAPSGIKCTTTKLSCVIPGLKNGTSYTFQVRATNASGTSAWSKASAAVKPVAVGPVLTASPAPGAVVLVPITVSPATYALALVLAIFGLVSLMIGILPATRRWTKRRIALAHAEPAGEAAPDADPNAPTGA